MRNFTAINSNETVAKTTVVCAASTSNKTRKAVFPAPVNLRRVRLAVSSLLLVLLSCLGNKALAQLPIVYWSFENAAHTSQSLACTDQLTGTNGTVASSVTTGGTYTTSSVSGAGVLHGGVSAGLAISTTTNNTSNPGVAAANYWQFLWTSSMVTGYTLNWDEMADAAGATIGILYTTNGGTSWNVFGTIAPGTTWGGVTAALPAAANGVRFYGFANPARVISLDNVMVLATTTVAGKVFTTADESDITGMMTGGLSGQFSRTNFTVTGAGTNISINPNTTLSGPLMTGAFAVSASGTLTLPSAGGQVSGAGSFTLNSGATLVTSNTNGIPGGIATTTQTFAAGANYVFNAATTTPFGTGALGNPSNVTINVGTSNSLVMNASTTITGQLLFSGGKLALNGNSLGLSGTVSGMASGGAGVNNITGSATSSLSFTNAGALGTNMFLDQTTPGTSNSLYSLTINGAGGVTLGASSPVIVGAGGLALTSGTLADGGNLISCSGNITGTGTESGTGGIAMTGASISGATIQNLTLNAGSTLSGNTNITGVLTLGSNVLATGAFTITVPGISTIGTTGGGYINGSLTRTLNGVSIGGTVNYPVGDASAATSSVVLNGGAAYNGSLTISCAAGNPSTISSSLISMTQNAGHYWTMSSSGASLPASETPTFNYSSITGGTQTSFNGSIYNGASWSGDVLLTNTGTYSSAYSSGVALSGTFVVGMQVVAAPTLTAVTGPIPTEDNWSTKPIAITGWSSAWQSAIAPGAGGYVTAAIGASVYTLTPTTDYVITGSGVTGTFSLTPTVIDHYLTTSGTYTLTVVPGSTYAASVGVQSVSPGAAVGIAVTTAPVGSAAAPALTTQPIVSAKDQFGNVATTYVTSVVASAVGGSWTIGGTSTSATTAGVANAFNFTATYVSSPFATVLFTSGSFTTSATFSIPVPAGTPTSWYTRTASTSADLTQLTSWTSDPSGGAGATPFAADFTNSNRTWDIYWGTTPSLGANWALTNTTVVNVGNGTNPVTFVIPGTFGISTTNAPVNVANNATLYFNCTGLITTARAKLNTVSPGSTVIYGGAGNYQYAIPVTYGNLTINGTASVFCLQNAVTNFTIANNMTVSGNAFYLPYNQVTGHLAYTYNIAGNLTVKDGGVIQVNGSSAALTPTVVFNVKGNDTLSGSSEIINAFYTTAGVPQPTIRLNGTTPQIMYSNPTSGFINCANVRIAAGAIGVVPDNTTYIVMDPAAGIAYANMIDSGTLIIGSAGNTAAMTDIWVTPAYPVTIASGATLQVGDPLGIVNAALDYHTFGGFSGVGSLTLSADANYVFNGTNAAGPQVTGSYFNTTGSSGGSFAFISGGSVTCNSPAGLSFSNAGNTFASGSTIKLQNGTLNTGNISLSAGVNVNVDNGHFDATPAAYSNIHLTYNNLGNNNLAVSTASSEWPSSFNGDVVINKPSATISLNSSKSLVTVSGTAGVTLTSGILAGGSNSLSLQGNWLNNAGTGAWSSTSGVVSLNGTSGAQSIGGSQATTFSTLNINNSGSGVTLNVTGGSPTTIFASGATLQLQKGALTTTSAVSMASGSNMVRDGGTISATPATYSGVNLTYADLGNNIAVTTNNEWPNSFTGSVTDNKTATVTLNAGSYAVNGNITLSNGTLAAGANAMSLTGNWTNNNSGATPLSGTNTVTLNGGGSQTIGGTFTCTFYNLTLGAAATLTYNAAVTNTLALGNFNLTTGVNNFTCPGNVAVTRGTGFVKGNLFKTLVTSPLNFEVGDVNYAPVSLALTGSPTGSIGVSATHGNHPALGGAGSVIDGTDNVAHYWTVTGTTGTAPTSVAPTFTYNTADVDGGSGTNTGYEAQLYNLGSWGSAISVGVTNTMTPTPSTSLPASAAYVGAFVIGKVPPGTPPSMFANYTPPTEDNLSTLPISFTDDGTWAENFTLVTAQRTGSPVISTLTLTTDYNVNGPGGTLSLIPGGGGHTYLDTAGFYTITVFSSGYTGSVVVQQILPGAAHHLVMATQPVGPVINGSTLATQPVVNIMDQYGNLTTSSAVVSAAVGTGSWTLGGLSTSATASSGSASFSSDALTATSLGPVTGATITFSSTGITSVTSAPFNIIAPPPPVLTAASGVTVDNPFVITFVDNATWRGAVTPTGVTVNGTTLPATAWSLGAGTLTLNPALSVLLQTAGTYTITVTGTGFSSTSCIQAIGIGVPSKLLMVTQPASPAFNGGPLATQPAVKVADQYNNLESASTALVTAFVGSGSWSIGGPSTNAAASSGIATFSSLTATSAAFVPSATILFTSPGLASVTSGTFAIPGPPANIYYNINTPIALSNLAVTTAWTTDAAGAASGSVGTGTNPPNFTAASSAYNIVNGTAPAITGAWAVSGLGSYVVVGNSSSTINFNAGPNAFTGTVNVNANATLTIGNSTLPSFGSLSTLSTVVFNGGGVQAIPSSVSYGNLVYSGTGTGALSASTYNILGRFKQTSGTVSFTPASIIYFNVADSFVLSGGTFQITTPASAAANATMNIYGPMILSGGTFQSNGLGTFNLYGDYYRTGLNIIGGNAFYLNFFFNNTSATQHFTSTATGTTFFVQYEAFPNVTMQMMNNYSSNAPGEHFYIYGTLDMQGFVYTGASSTFDLFTGGTLITQHVQGITTSGATGCIQTGARIYASGTSNYVYNGTSAQHTGNALPASFNAGYYVKINNAAGVTLDNTTTFNTGSYLNLQNGTLTNTASNLVMGGGQIPYLVIDNGHLSTTPTSYTPVLTYANLGQNQTTITTNSIDWPVAGYAGSVNINYPAATVSLDASKALTGTATAISLTAGTLDATTSNYGITTAGSWTNNAGISAFTARNGTVTFNGGTGVIGGTYGTTFNTLTIAANTTLSAATSFASGKTLNLQSGTFTNGSNLSMSSGSNVNVDAGTLSAVPSTYSGVNLTYTSLGVNSNITTGSEWPAAFTGNVTVNKTGKTITLGGTKAVTGPITITAGTLDASVSNYGISLTGNWTNNGTFTPQAGTVTFNGSSAQANSGTSASFYGLTLNNAAGLTLGLNTTVSNLLTLTNGIITTGTNKLTMTTAPGTVSRGVSSSSNYVNGTLEKAVTGFGLSTPINFEVGDADYAPVSISTSSNLTGAGATLAVTDTAGHHPNYASAVIDGTFYVDHYWTISAPVPPTGSFSITPTFSYNTPSDVGGGSNISPAPWVSQMWNGTSWNAVNLLATDPTGNSTSVPTTSSSYLGQYIVGLNDANAPPVFTAASGVTEDNAPVTPATFVLSPATGPVPSMADWRAHITLVTARRSGGPLVNLVGGGTDYAHAAVGTSGTFSLVPTSSDNYLTTAGVYTINISSVGYTTATLVQTIDPGAPAAMSITDQPTNVTTNGSVIPGITPPYVVVSMTDQFGNPASGSATITANAVPGVGGATWTAGSNVVTGSSPITFSTTTASSLGAVTGASIQFTGVAGVTTLTPTTSNTFNINAPAPPVLTAAAGATVDNPFSITYPDNSVWRAAITSVLVNGSGLPPAAWSTSAGNLTLTPSASSLLQTVGSYTITVLATGFAGDVLSTQAIGAGVGANLVISVQPTAPAFNGGPLATQPVVLIKDHYNNATTSTSAVAAGSSGGATSWTLGGTTTVNGVSGTVTYAGLTASSALADPGATITFSITSTYGTYTVTSNSFNIPNPPITYYDKTGVAVDLSILSNWTTSASGAGGSSPASFTSNSQKFVIRNGSNPTLTAGSLTISGTGSYLNVGNDTSSVNFVVPSGQAYNGLINISNGSTLTTANTTMPTWGSLSSSSTVVFNGTSQAIPVTPSYGNLTFNGTTGTIASGTLTIGGTFSVTGSSTLTAPNTGVISVTGPLSVSGGTLTNAGTGTINLRGNLSVTGTGAITGTTLNTVNFINTATTQNITWTGGANANTQLNINASCTGSLSSGLPLSGGASVVVNGTLNCGTNAISGSGAFTLNNGGTVNTANTSGLTGSITTTTKTFNAGANYIFSAASGISTPWISTPGAPNNVTISNAVTMTNNASFSPTGTLTVPSGAALDMGSAFVLGGSPTIANSGTIQTEVPTSTSATPLPSGLTWGGTVAYAGSAAQTVVTGTFNNLTLNNAGGASLTGNASVNGALALTSGNLNVGANTLTLGSSATTPGSFSSSNMIVAANASGKVLKTYSGSGSFTYPVGDATPGYSPITLNVTGAGSASVYVRNVKQPNNAGASNYINRYWHIAVSGLTNYSVTSANYVFPGDVVGTESRIHAGEWTGSMPWILGAVEVGHALSTGTITRPVTELSGIDGPMPSFTVAPTAATCAGVGNDVTYATEAGQTNYIWTVSGAPGTDYTITAGGIGSTDNSVTLYWISTGSKTVTVTYTDGDGIAGITPATNATFVSSLTLSTSNNSPACVGGTVNLTSTVGGTASPVTYSWSGPIGYSSTDANPVLSITSTAMGGTYTLVATGGGCSLTSTTIVTVSPTPTTAATNDGPACVGSTVNLDAGADGATSYSWAGPGGFTSSSSNPVLSSVTTAMSGIYTVTVSSGLCSATSTTTVVINSLASAPSNDGPACVGGTVNLLSNVTGSATPVSYSWSGPAGFTATSADVVLSSVTTAMSGVYSFTVTAAGTGCISTGTTTVTIGAISVSATNSSPVCLGGTINLFGTPTGSVVPDTYTWSGPLGYSSTQQNPVLTTSATTAYAGVYTLTVTSGGVGCTATSTTTVSIGTIGITAGNDGPACVGGTINLSSTPSGSATPTGYSWSGPLGFSSALQNPAPISSIALGRAGVYTVTVSGAGSGCSATATTNVVVNTLGISASNSSPTCVGLTTSLNSTPSGSATPTAYSWSGPLLFSAGTQNTLLTSVTTDMSGTYTVTVTAAGNGCTAFATTNVSIIALPQPITGNTSFCVGGTTTVSDVTTGGTWSSTNTGVATIGTAGLPTAPHTVSGLSAGTATISYTVGTGCATTLLITVNPNPVITGMTPVCVGSTVALSDNIAGGLWTAQNTKATVGSTSGIVTGVAFGTDNITYTLPTTCRAISVATINPLPSAIGGTARVCQGMTTTLNTTSSGGTWVSSNPSVATVGSTGGTTTVTGITAGSAVVSYVLPTGCYTSVVVTVNALSPITGNAPVCQGSTLTLSDAAVGGTWVSSNTGIATVGSVSGVVSGVAGGTARISYTTFAGCLAVSIATVNPIAVINGNAGVCEGATTSLSDITVGGAWSSSNGNATVGTGAGLVSGVTAGTATISYQIISTGCTATRVVTVSAAPGVITGTAVVCAGQTTALTDAVSGGTWISSAPAKATVGSTDGMVTGVAAGTSIISYKMTAGGCQSTRIVTVNTTPAAITGNVPVCQSATVLLHEGTGGGSWSTTDVAASVSATGLVTGLSGGTATITYGMPTGCQATAVVTVNPITPITGAAPVCVGSSVALTDATPGGTWSSSAPAKGTVDASGNVTGIAGGNTTITYLIAATGCKATVVETVNALPGVINGTKTVCAGGSSVHLSDVTAGGTWGEVDGSGSASIDGSGNVTGLSPGTATINYVVGGCGVSATITINASPALITGNTPTCAGSLLSLIESVGGGTWSSTTPSVATVNSSGVVTTVAGGTSTISYTTGAGCNTSVIVTVNTILPITGITSVCLGSTTNLADATLGGTWMSSDAGTASVGTSGIVTGNLVGTAIISYTAPSGCIRTTGVTVNPVPSAIAGTLSLCNGGTTTLSDDGSGSWSSLNTTVATVGAGTGIVTGASAGTATIKYTAGSGCFVSAVVTVNAGPSPIGGAASVCAGSSISVSDLMAGGAWSTADVTASVISTGSTTGSVTGISAGTAMITYTAPTGGCFVTRTIVINPVPAAISGNPVVCIGHVTFLSDATTPGVSWTSGTPSVATVSGSGAVTGVSGGTANITYSIGTGCNSSVTVTVTALPSSISGNTPLCPGNTMLLTDASTGGTWTSNNPAIASVGTDGTVTGVTGGNATITYTVNGGGCYATTVVTVTTITAINGASVVCTGTSITLSNASAGGTWSSADGTVSIATPSVGSVLGVSAGTATITYTFAGGGCAAMKVITVNTTPTAINGNALLCIGTQLMLTDDVTGGAWSSSNGAIAAVVGSTGVTTGMAAGTARITYALGGCSVNTTVTVNTASPVTGFSSICAGAIANMHNATSGGTWSSSNTATGTISAGGVLTGLAAGTTTVSYTLASGCVSTLTVTVNPVPDAITGNGAVCVGGSLALSDDITGGIWSSSNGVATVDGTTGMVTAVATGTSTITYTVAGCFTTTVVTVGATPAAISGPLTVCEGGTIILNDATLGGAWSSTTSNATIDASTGVVSGVTAGTTTISYTLAGCGSVTVDVTVNASPAALSGNMPMCIGSGITLGETTGGGAWSSSNGNATVDGSGNVSGIAAGTATISYTAGSCSATTVVTVVGMPAAITGSSFVCVGGSTTLNDATPGGLWSSADATISIGTGTGVVTGVSIGTASVTYTTSTGCYATATITVNTATAPINGPSTVCVGSSTLYTDATGGGVWSSSTTSVATIATDGTVTGVAAGTTTLSYVTGGCISTMSITVSAAPSAITGPASVCANSTIALTDATAGGTWTTGSGNISVDGSGNVTGISAGVGIVTYTSGTGCSVTKNINVNPQPTAINGLLTVCTGATTFLSDGTGGGVSWTSNTPSVATVSFSGAVLGVAPGTTTITYSITSGCYITAVVTVNALPAAISNNSAICQGASIVLTDATAGGTWSSNHTGIASTGTDGTLTGVSAGNATITYTVYGAGCYATTVATVNPAPNAGTITGSGIVCVGATTNLMDAASGGVWSSTTGSVAAVNTSGVVLGVSAGTTTISYTVTNSCGIVAATMTVTVNALPVPGTITGSAPICAGTTLSLTDATAGGNWSSSNANATVDGSGTVTGVTGGTATISYTVTNGCGSASATTVVTINAIAPITGSLSMCVGFTSALSDATTGGLWSSTNTAVATVGSTTGVVNGLTAGTSVISYAAPTGCTRAVTVTVTSSLPPITGTLAVCQTFTTALSDATGGGVWTSGSPSIATVGGSTGIVTGSVAGTAHITYAVGGSCLAITTVTVNPQPSGIGGAAAVCIGSTITLSDPTLGGDWTSAGNVSAAATGTTLTTVTPSALGTGTVTYTLLSTGCKVAKTITVNDVPTAILGNLSVCGVGSVTFLSDATSGTSWVISPVGTATVSAGGRVYGVSPGTATVTYTGTNTCKATAVVTVNALVTVAAISGANNVSSGSTITLSDITPGGNWSSSNPAIGSVDATGDVTGVAVSGTVTISYNLPYGSGCNALATKSISVHTPAPHAHGTTVAGTQTVFTGTIVNIADETTDGIWSSSNTTIATVDGAGTVTGIAPGTANITHIVTYDDGEVATTITPVVVSVLPVDIRIVPNPNNGAFTIKGNLGTLQDEEVSIEVTDVLGQVVYSNKITTHGGKINEKVSMDNTYANGMYMLTIHSGTENKVFHFVIEK